MPCFFLQNKAVSVKSCDAELSLFGDDALFSGGAHAMFGMGDAISAVGVMGDDVEPFHAQIVLRTGIKFKVWKRN